MLPDWTVTLYHFNPQNYAKLLFKLKTNRGLKKRMKKEKGKRKKPSDFFSTLILMILCFTTFIIQS